MFKIPNDRKWTQTNSSDLFGTIQRSRNMNFDDAGYAKLAKRARSIYFQVGDFERVSAIEYLVSRNEYVVMTTQGIAIVDGTTLAVTSGTLASNAPGSDTNGLSDLVSWQGRIYSNGPAGNGLRYYDSAGAWNTTGYTTTAVAGPLCVFEKKNFLAIGQASSVYLVNTSHVEQTAILSIPSDFRVTSLCNYDSYMVVGTRHINNGEAKVFLWDGNSAVANNAYGVGTHRINSVKPYQGTFVIVTSLGELLKFNGGGFTRLDAFPIFYKEQDWDVDGNITSGRVIHRGVFVDGDLIHINLSSKILLKTTDSAGKVLEDYFEGGIWCYDPKVGLYGRYNHTSSLRVSNTIATSDVNTTDNIITVSSAPVTGTPIIYDNSGSTTLAGLTHREKYYAIYVTSTTIKLATSRQNAFDGVAIDLTGTGNNSQLLIYIPNKDFGGSGIGGDTSPTGAGGAINYVANRTALYRTNGAQVIFGTRIGGSSTSESFGLAVATFGQENRGYIITSKLLASGITDQFTNLTIKYRGVETVEDVLVVKYRTIERMDELKGIDQALTMTATWVNTSRFTTTADLSDAKVGDEVSFHSGSGSGYMVHIDSISESGGTYTVNINEVVQNVTGGDTCCFVIENWNKLGSITTADNDYFTNDNGDRYMSIGGAKTFNILKPSKQLEIKVELRGEDVAIEDILVNNRPFKQFIV